MNDLREGLLNDINSKLALVIGQDELQPVMDAIILSLERYELNERTTEVGFHTDVVERLQQRCTVEEWTFTSSRNSLDIPILIQPSDTLKQKMQE